MKPTGKTLIVPTWAQLNKSCEKLKKKNSLLRKENKSLLHTLKRNTPSKQQINVSENMNVINQCIAFLDIEEQNKLIKYMSRTFKINIH